ncbi:transposase [Crossiella sp. CA198]|uniref:transposase n=1 Tax=Crossiella sp. CA198 TaxID=3455607 RepID=UPI003F8D716B
MISVHHASAAAALGDLSGLRQEFSRCLTARADALFELTDAALCADGPVTSLVVLSLEPEHRRGHGALYDGLNQGGVDIGRFRNVVARQQVARRDDGRIVLAIDVSHWLRPDANTSPERLFCHTYARGKGQAQMVPGWPYSFMAALEPGRTSWTALLDVVRMRPSDDHTDLAATHLRAVVDTLITAEHWREGDPAIWIVGDSGYDGPRLAFLLADRHEGQLPIMEGTVIRLHVDRLPGTGTPKPSWLWYSATATTGQMDRLWQMFLRRFDLEHTFRFLKQTLGWTAPRVRTVEAADRWTWLAIAAYTQLRLARHLVEDLPRPWERQAAAPTRLSPTRVRRGFRRVCLTIGLSANAPKPTRPGPGRPAGSRNSRRAPLHDPGKLAKTDIKA